MEITAILKTGVLSAVTEEKVLDNWLAPHALLSLLMGPRSEQMGHRLAYRII